MNADDVSLSDIAADRRGSEEDSKSESVDDPTASFTSGSTTMVLGGPFAASAPMSITQTYTASNVSVTVKPQSVFDLAEMGIDRVGTFDSSGNLVGWTIDHVRPIPHCYANKSVVGHTILSTCPPISLEPAPDFAVFVRGIYSKHFTNVRRKAMGLHPI